MTSVLLASALCQAQISDGAWSTGCKNGSIKEQIYQAQEVHSSEKFFQDKGCNDLSFEFITTGTVQFAESQVFVDFSYVSIWLSLSKNLLVEDFKQRKVCGISDWQISDPREISGKNCAMFNYNKETPVPRAGDIRFGIYKTEENRLYYGQMTQIYDSTTPAKRPVLINRSTEYIFQPKF